MDTMEIIKYIAIILLYGAGIFALVSLGILLMNIAKTVKETKEILEDNRVDIDHSIHVIPQVLENVEDITQSISQMAEEAEPNVAMILDNISDTTSKVNRLTGTVEDTTNSVMHGVKDLTNGVRNVGNNVIDAVNSVVDTAGSIGDSIKYKFYKREKSAADKALSLIDKIKDMIG